MGGESLVIECLTSGQALVHSQGLSACCTPDLIASRGGQAEGIKAQHTSCETLKLKLGAWLLSKPLFVAKGFLPLVRLICTLSQAMPMAALIHCRCSSLLTSARFWSSLNLKPST